MRTIGPKVPPDLPLGDFVSRCDYCKVPRYRSQLRRDGSQKLTCEYCGDGPDATTLLEGNAEKALRWAGRQEDLAESVYDGAPFSFAAPERPEAAPTPTYQTFGVLPVARAAWGFSSRLTGAYADQLLDVANGNTYKVTPAGAPSGLDAALDESAIVSACGVAQGRAAWIYDQSGNGNHLQASALYGGLIPNAGNIARIPLIYDSSAITKVNGKPALKCTTNGNTAQGQGQAYRFGTNVGLGGTWDPKNNLGFSGSPDITVAWVGRCRDDGLGVVGAAGILGRYAWGIGQYYSSQIALVCNTPTQLFVHFGVSGAITFNLTLPWTQLQHIVVQHAANGAVRLWQDGVELHGSASGSSALNLAPSDFGAVTLGCSNYDIHYGLWDKRACIVFDRTFGDSDRSVLFENLSALRDA